MFFSSQEPLHTPPQQLSSQEQSLSYTQDSAFTSVFEIKAIARNIMLNMFFMKDSFVLNLLHC